MSPRQRQMALAPPPGEVRIRIAHVFADAFTHTKWTIVLVDIFAFSRGAC